MVIKIKIICEGDKEDVERDISDFIKDKKIKDKDLIDIKYGVTVYQHSAMIIYEGGI